MTASPVLETNALRKTYRDGDTEHVVFTDVDLQIMPGERVALEGPSGSGKSSFLQICGALDAEHQGTVSFQGKNLATLTERERAHYRNTHIGFVFQAFNLLKHLTVRENIALPQRFGAKVVEEQVQAVAERVAIADKLHRRPPELSGGEQQRVAIARALVHRPRLVLCDEPTGNLDAKTGAAVIALLDEFVADGASVLIATHNDSVAEGADRRLSLVDGRLVP